MATVEQHETRQDGRQAGAAITVENPATGEAIGDVPSLDREAVVELVARARRAQPAWEALGFEGRAAVMRDMRR